MCKIFFEVQELVPSRFCLKVNTRCGSGIPPVVRIKSKIILSPKTHNKSFENAEIPERIMLQNVISCSGSHRDSPAGRFSHCKEKTLA